MMNNRVWSLVLILGAAMGVPQAAAGRLEKELDRQLSGAWAIVLTEAYSNCNGFYSNNEANLSGVASKAMRRFDNGELVKIDKINLKRARIDLFMTLEEPVLMSRVEGPFELFDESRCKVQMMVSLPRAIVKSGDLDSVLSELDPLLELHRSIEDARQSVAFNQRQREEYPPDYELTLARHAVWQAETLNAAVAERIAAANQDAQSAALRIHRDEQYLDGFGAGVEDMRSWHERDCPDLLDVSVSSVGSDPSGGGDRGADWAQGYADGQELLFNLVLAERLQSCFVPVPPLP